MCQFLLTVLWFNLVLCSLIVPYEECNLKNCVRDVIKNVVDVDTTVLYVYNNDSYDIFPDEMANPFVKIDISNNITVSNTYRMYDQILILNFEEFSFIDDCFTTLINNSLWSLKTSTSTKYLVTFPLERISELEEVFSYFFRFDIIDLIVMAYDFTKIDATVKMLTWDPHHPSNNCGQDFNFTQEYTCKTIKTNSNSKRWKNYNNCTLTHYVDEAWEWNETQTEVAGIAALPKRVKNNSKRVLTVRGNRPGNPKQHNPARFQNKTGEKTIIFTNIAPHTTTHVSALISNLIITVTRGLVKPYYSFMNNHTVNSLEECLLKLKDYDNHRQQANFMNYMRQTGQNKQNYKPINNYQKPLQFKPHQNNSPNFNPQNASRQFNYNPQISTNNQHKQNFSLRGPINIQNRPITTRYPTNNEVFGKKIESKPTPMSISTRNTNANYRPNFPRQQNVFQSNGPRNFKSEELFNINEGHNDSEPIQDDFEDRLVDYNEDLIEADENNKSYYSESPVNFRIPTSEELTST
ncbi:hypothetical protein FQA39_LY13902 [Lamprigera yunnana]|nr:hypothetical protein FQA39_LY13902 [Lamprigera yunnana]